MGYTKSPFAIQRVEAFLKQMLESSTSLEWTVSDAYKVAYYIREGIAVAKAKKSDYAVLSGKYIIRARGNKLIAQLRIAEPSIIELKRTLNRIVINDVRTILEILGALIKHKAEEMIFPEAQLDEESLGRLYLWTNANGYFIVVSDSGAITVTVADPGELKWMPKQNQ